MPCASVLWTVIVLSWASAIACEIASPRPVPGMALAVALDARKKRSKSRGSSSAGMPMPVSLTLSAMAPPSCDGLSPSTRPPSGVNLTAFETRLSTSCAIRARSQTAGASAAGFERQLDLLGVRGRLRGLGRLGEQLR